MCLPRCEVIAMGTYNCHSPRGWCGGHGQPVGKQFDVCVHVLRLCLYQMHHTGKEQLVMNTVNNYIRKMYSMSYKYKSLLFIFYS